MKVRDLDGRHSVAMSNTAGHPRTQVKVTALGRLAVRYNWVHPAETYVTVLQLENMKDSLIRTETFLRRVFQL
jgi:hypothetical protein